MTTQAEMMREAAAQAMWQAFVEAQTRPEDWPTWGELLAQGHQGLSRVNEFRAYAAAAIRAMPLPETPRKRVQPAITRDDDTISGKWRIAGTRISTRAIYDAHVGGWDTDRMIAEWHGITAEDVRLAIEFEERARAGDPETAGKLRWAAAVERWFVEWEMFPDWSAADPWAELHRMICFEQKVALDPAVSDSAYKLVERAKAEAGPVLRWDDDSTGRRYLFLGSLRLGWVSNRPGGIMAYPCSSQHYDRFIEWGACFDTWDAAKSALEAAARDALGMPAEAPQIDTALSPTERRIIALEAVVKDIAEQAHRADYFDRNVILNIIGNIASGPQTDPDAATGFGKAWKIEDVVRRAAEAQYVTA